LGMTESQIGSICFFSRSEKFSRVMAPSSFPSRVRTDTVLFSASRAPTTSR